MLAPKPFKIVPRAPNGCEPFRVALLYSSEAMRRAALESCFTTLLTLSEFSRVEILALPWSRLHDSPEMVTEEPSPDLLVFASDQIVECLEDVESMAARWIDNDPIALVGVFGVNPDAPLAADHFHRGLAKIANRCRSAYFSKTVFLTKSNHDFPIYPANESILNE